MLSFYLRDKSALCSRCSTLYPYCSSLRSTCQWVSVNTVNFSVMHNFKGCFCGL
nr:MAG TPA: hypothetical protein [Caudoviricetes sp.]